MKTFKRCLLLIMALTTAFCSFGCSKTSTMDFTCFNTGIHVEVQGKTLSDELQIKIKNTLYNLEEKFSVKDGSFTKTFNDSLVGKQFALDYDTSTLIYNAKFLYSFTDKDFNPAVYPLVKLWQFSPNFPALNFTLPSESDITNLTQDKYLNFDNLVVDRDYTTATKTSELELDFGGILKGFATEYIYELLHLAGYSKGYVNVGGSSLKILSSNTLAIRHPENVSNNIIRVDTKNLTNFGVSTSGTYERFYTLDGKTYSHIIDPSTGKPAETNVLSATIINTDGTFGDAVTTALLLKDFDKSSPETCELSRFIQKILTHYKDAYVFVVYNDGTDKCIITNKESETFTLLDDTYTVVKI
ncbi:MAG: FAD:protein FMN transferase [Clostridia bacterium]|nr:FAD:protein FMN transferase [Clostridia bacterium]